MKKAAPRTCDVPFSIICRARHSLKVDFSRPFAICGRRCDRTIAEGLRDLQTQKCRAALREHARAKLK